MEKEYFISMFLDARRAKANNKYPVKLRIFTPNPRKQMLYSTKFEFSKNEFKSIWQTLKPREEHKEDRNKMMAVEIEANKIAEKLTPFSFIRFEKLFLRNTGDGTNIIYQYNQTINKLKSNNRYGTASNYELSLKSLLNFISHLKGNLPIKLSFSEINPEWLNKYENYMVNDLKRSQSTVGIYLRPLRAIFNTAIAENEIALEIYPFGKRKFQIPAGRNVKKAFHKSDLQKLFSFSTIKGSYQEKARDFWFFSYQCNGMNIRDISELKYKDIKGDRIVFNRNKTKNTTKKNIIPIVVPITKFVKKIIKKYGNKPEMKEKYIFPIFSDGINEMEKLRRNKNFTKFINQHIKKLAKAAGLTSDISTYWARHSFTTTAIRNGASLELIQESLGHQDKKTTMNYWGGFEDSVKRGISEKLMDFN